MIGPGTGARPALHGTAEAPAGPAKIVGVRHLTQNRARACARLNPMDTTARIRPGITWVARTALLVGCNVHIATAAPTLLPVTAVASVIGQLLLRRRASGACRH